MNLVAWAIALFTSAYAQITNRGQSCTTPNNEHATCIAARSCKLIFEPLGTRDPMAIDFAKRSLCGYDTEPLFCCGSLAHFDPERINGTGSVSSRLDTNKVLPDISLCGLEKEPERVQGGEVADFDEFPWMAALEYKEKSSGASLGIKCGGSVIAERYILTAARCLTYTNVQISRAWLGDWNITSDPDCVTLIANIECSDRVEKINIERIIPHSGFNVVTGRDDIGLLRLERAVRFTDYIRPICLPTEAFPDPLDGSHLTVAGWGINHYGRQSDVKLKGDLLLLSNVSCNAKLPVPLTADRYCAEGENVSCIADSGGPLMQKTNTPGFNWYQEGIVSYGLLCGGQEYPIIYTRVSKYVNWIVNSILQDKF